ncbi:MAG: carboxypeptidase regulatory-like domain-containing protein [Blastocatellia bacterium]
MSARTNKLICMCLLLGLCLSAAPAAAQDITGSIVGIVKDPTGALVPGATVTVRDEAKNIVVRTVTTNEEGAYSVPLLLIGHYSVTIEAAGFKTFTQRGIELNVNDRLTVDATLEVGTASEVIQVEAGAVQVELQSATASGLVSSVEVRELPLNNRNFVQLVTLMPGVTSGLTDQAYIGATNPFGQTNTVSISINGARSSQNSWTVDGADNVDRGSNLTLLNYPSVDAIAEFKVLRNHYSAEYGRSASGHVNVVTKSGTSEFHGTAYEFFRNDKLNANTYFNNLAGRFTTDPAAKAPDLIVPAGDPRAGKERNPRPILRYNNFGYTIGGPVFIPHVYNTDKSKTFFFWSQEFRRVITYANLIATVPTAEERRGIFSAPVCVETNAAGTACARSATQVSNINPAAAAYLQDIYNNIPLPNGGGNTLITNVRNIFNHRQELIRIDHNFSTKFNLAVRYLHDTIPTEEPGGLFTASVLPGVATTKTDSPGYSWVVRSVQTLRPTLLNESGYAFSYGAIISRPIGLNLTENSPSVAAAISLPFTSTLSRIPSVVFGSTTSPVLSNISGFGPYDDFNRNHNFYDNVTWLRGRHTVKFGTSIHFYQKTENAAGNNVGTFTIATTPRPAGSAATTTQQAWANFLLGNVSSFTQASEDLTPDVRSRQYEFFIQDDFRVRSNLTLNMGVRYSRFRQPFDKSGKLTNFDPRAYDPARAVQINPATGNIIPGTGDPLNGIIIADENSPFGDKVTPESNRDFAPVFGFAWDPWRDGKTAVRGGYGLSYDTTLFGVVEQNIFGNPPFVNNIVISNTSLNNPGAVVPTVSAAPKAIRGIPNDNDVPYIQQWSLGVQREVAKDFLIDVGYFGSKGTNLAGIVDINQVPAGAAIAAGIIQPGQAVTAAVTPRLNALRPYKGFVSINTIQNWFNSNYHSLQVASEKRFSDSSLVKIAYTWSKALTDNQTDRSSAPQSFYDRAADYGPAQLDRRHVFSLDYVYMIPFFRNQKGLVGHALGGWQLSGITSVATGTPLTITTTGVDPAALGLLGTSASSGRPDVVGDPELISSIQTRLKWFNTNAFALVPTGVNRIGNAPRGVLYGPGYQRWDVTLSKRFQIRESMDLQFRAEAYNVFNHTNFNTVGTVFGSTTFGQVTGVRDPRLIQFALKLNY